MRAEHHLIISLLLSLVFFIVTKSILGSILCFIAGFLVDSDHIFDYVLQLRKLPTSIEDFLNHFYGKEYTRIWLIFHSWELVPIIYFVGRFLLGDVLTYGILLGFVSHILCDSLYNPIYPLTYFMTYRISVGFDATKFTKA